MKTDQMKNETKQQSELDFDTNIFSSSKKPTLFEEDRPVAKKPDALDLLFGSSPSSAISDLDKDKGDDKIFGTLASAPRKTAPVKPAPAKESDSLFSTSDSLFGNVMTNIERRKQKKGQTDGKKKEEEETQAPVEEEYQDGTKVEEERQKQEAERIR